MHQLDVQTGQLLSVLRKLHAEKQTSFRQVETHVHGTSSTWRNGWKVQK